MRALATSLVAWLALSWTGAALAAPECADTCTKLAAEGSLAEGVTVEICTLRVCQEAGRELYAENRFEEALAALEHIQEKRLTSTVYYLDRGLVLYALGRYDGALEDFDKVVRVFPNGVRGGSQRAFTLARLGRFDAAIQQFRKLEASPQAESTYHDLRTGSYLAANIGVLELQRGRLTEGRAELERALQIDGKNQLASSLLRRVVPYLESRDLGPDGFRELQLSTEELSLGRVRSSSNHLHKLLSDWPRFGPGYLVLSQGLRNQGYFDQCEKVLIEAEKHLPKDTEIRVQRIRCGLLRRGVASAASRPLIAELKQIAAEQPANELAVRLLKALDQ